MAEISQAEFLQMQQERQAARQAATANRFNGPRVSYFSLKDDGDEAIVRFAYTSPEELSVYFTHPVTIDGKFRRVNCLNTHGKDPNACPLCAAGQKFQARTYLKLVEYVRDETTGQVNAVPKVWERPATYNSIIQGLFTEYGDISNSVFKVKRIGAKGSKDTTYQITYGIPSVYNDQVYKKDFSAFADYKILGGPLLDKSFAELQELVGDAQITQPVIQPQVAQPIPVAPAAPTYNPGPTPTPTWATGAPINVSYK